MDIIPHKSDSIPINNKEHDNRVKLTDIDHEKIRKEYTTGNTSQRILAKKYNVSRRLIQFILDPEKANVAKKQFAKRQQDGRYYDRKTHNAYTKKHRDHKKALYKKGLLKTEREEE